MGVAVRRPIDTSYERLKPGPGKSPDQVRASQQARIHRAMIELVAERGFSGLTVRGLTHTSGVSTRTFYAHFPNVEECFASVYRAVVRRLAEQLSEATTANEDLEQGVRSWIRSWAESASDGPDALRLAFVDVYEAGPAMLREAAKEITELERLVATEPNPIPMPLAQGIVAGVTWLIATRLQEQRQHELRYDARELADWVLRIHTSEFAPQCRMSHYTPVRRDSHDEDPGLAAIKAIGGERGRILGAVSRLGARYGYWSLTGPRVRREAGVSRRGFESLFRDVTDCYLEAVEVMLIAAARRAQSGIPPGEDWRCRIAAASDLLVAEVKSSPILARLAFTESFEPGGAASGRSAALIATAARWLRTKAPPGERPSSLTAEVSAVAAWRSVEASLMGSGSDRRPQATTAWSALIAAAFSRPCEPLVRDRKHCVQKLD